MLFFQGVTTRIDKKTRLVSLIFRKHCIFFFHNRYFKDIFIKIELIYVLNETLA